MKSNIKLPTLEDFKKTCTNHDWLYYYSDDYSVYLSGSEEATLINTIVKLGGEQYKNIWHEAAKERGVL